jgi:hypothetical protein
MSTTKSWLHCSQVCHGLSAYVLEHEHPPWPQPTHLPALPPSTPLPLPTPSTDAAFAAALKKLGTTADALLGNKELLTKILQFHVLPNAMDSDLLSIPDLQLTTLLGEGRDLVTKVDG